MLGVAVLDNIGDAAAELICLDSDDKSPRELEDYLDDLKDRMRTVPGVCNLKEVGTMHEHIAIYLDKERMVKYGINRSMINAMLTLQNITTGGAHADNSQVDVPIYVSKMGQTERDLADQIIYSGPDGKHIRLKDVARVVREYPEIESYIANNGHRAVLLSMEMMSGGDIVAFGEEVNKRMEEFQKTMSKVYSTTVCEGTLDESPMAYKNGDEIRELIEPTAEIYDHLIPVYNYKSSS